MKLNKTSITGIIALLADLTGLIMFFKGILNPDSNIFYIHPAFLIIVAFGLLIYGNLAIIFSLICVINTKYETINESPDINDTENLVILYSYLLWIPSFLIWVVILYTFPESMVSGLKILFGFIVFFLLIGGGIIMATWSSLIHRVFRPKDLFSLNIK